MYNVGKKIGSSTYGEVFMIQLPNGQTKALKKVNPRLLSYIELDILFRLDCPYLVKGHMVVETKQNKGVIMDLLKGDLHSFEFKDYKDLFRIFGTLSYALNCLHSKGFLHLDIKPSNCFYDTIHEKNGETYNAFLADYGLSLRCDSAGRGITSTSLKSTPGYSPPDVMKSYLDKTKFYYNNKTDIFSLGVTFMRLLGFKYGFPHSIQYTKDVYDFWVDFSKDSLNNIIKIIKKFNSKLIVKIPELHIHNLANLIDNMVTFDSENRIDAKELIQSPIFEGISLNSKCIVKPEEFYYIPYINTYTMKGLNALRNRFKETYPTLPITIYFLSVEYFLELISFTSRNITVEEYMKVLNDSFSGAINYYRGRFPDKSNEEDAFILPLISNGKLGVNRYYYHATKLDHLKLVDDLILKSPSMIHFYLLIDLKKFFRYLDENYDVKDNKIRQNITFEEFEKMKTPERISETMINFAPSEYSNAPKQLKMKKDSDMEKYAESEKELRVKLLHIAEEKIEKYKIVLSEKIEKANKVLDSTDAEGEYYKLVKKKSLAHVIKNTVSHLNYSILTEKNINDGEIEEYNIFFDSKGSASLLRVKERVATHYFSLENKKLKERCESENLEYKYEEKSGINPCRILEAGLIIMIYTARKLDIFNIKMLRCSDNTLRTLLLTMILDEAS